MTKQTKTVKSYGTTSHAKRALKAIGTAALQAYDKLVTINEDGRFEFILEKAEAIQDKADNAKQETYDAPKASPKVDHGPSNRLIAAAIAKDPTLAPKKPTPEQSKSLEKMIGAPTVGEIVRESTVERPCKLVWHIADEMVGARRKDVLAVCVARGVAFYTARTQYQLWLSIKNGTAK